MSEAKREVWVIEYQGDPVACFLSPGGEKPVEPFVSVRYVPESKPGSRHMDMAQSLHSFEGAQADSDILAIAKALAAAEQAGKESATPPTNGHQTCAGNYAGTINELIHRLEVCIAEEQEQSLPRNHFIAVMCDAIRFASEEGARPFTPIVAPTKPEASK